MINSCISNMTSSCISYIKVYFRIYISNGNSTIFTMSITICWFSPLTNFYEGGVKRKWSNLGMVSSIVYFSDKLNAYSRLEIYRFLLSGFGVIHLYCIKSSRLATISSSNLFVSFALFLNYFANVTYHIVHLISLEKSNLYAPWATQLRCK